VNGFNIVMQFTSVNPSRNQLTGLLTLTDSNPKSIFPSKTVQMLIDMQKVVNLTTDSTCKICRTIAGADCCAKGPSCTSYKSDMLVTDVYHAVLGRDPSSAERSAAMLCLGGDPSASPAIAGGNLAATDLEGANDPISMCPTVQGLQSLPEYAPLTDPSNTIPLDSHNLPIYPGPNPPGKKAAALKNIYRLYLGSFPSSSDPTYQAYLTGSSYMGGVKTDGSNFIAQLQTTVAQFKSDNHFAANAVPTHLEPLQEVYDYIYGPGYKTATATDPNLVGHKYPAHLAGLLPGR